MRGKGESKIRSFESGLGKECEDEREREKKKVTDGGERDREIAREGESKVKNGVR